MTARFRRVLVCMVVAAGLLSVVPATAFAGAGGPACGDILTSNTTLTADLDCSAYPGTALFIGKHRLVLDLNGHTIWGFTGDDGWYGVHTLGYNHAVIRDGTIANFNAGIFIDTGSYNTRVKNVDIVGEAADTDDFGVSSYHNVATKVRNSTISGVTTGVALQSGANAALTGNTISTDNGGNAIEQYFQNQDYIAWNTLMAADTGVYGQGIHDSRYVGNTANDGVYGFYLDCWSGEGGRPSLVGNTANDNVSDGFFSQGCSSWEAGSAGPTFDGNTALRNGGSGFYSDGESRATWIGNVAKWNGVHGFHFFYPWRYKVQGNVASRNGGHGFYLSDADSTVTDFSNNRAHWNGDHGMYADAGVPGTGNRARNNSVRNCFNVLCNE